MDVVEYSTLLITEQTSAITLVANLTRRDGEEFLEIAPRVPVKTKTETFPLEEANAALQKFRAAELAATAVLRISES